MANEAGGWPFAPLASWGHGKQTKGAAVVLFGPSCSLLQREQLVQDRDDARSGLHGFGSAPGDVEYPWRAYSPATLRGPCVCFDCTLGVKGISRFCLLPPFPLARNKKTGTRYTRPRLCQYGTWSLDLSRVLARARNRTHRMHERRVNSSTSIFFSGATSRRSFRMRILLHSSTCLLVFSPWDRSTCSSPGLPCPSEL